jgi:glycosyltransferase involved in cell wall biosynthesis
MPILSQVAARTSFEREAIPSNGIPTKKAITCAMLTGPLSRRAAGMFESIRQLANALQNAGVQISLLGVHDEFTDADASQWGPLKVEALPTLGPRSFAYAPGLQRALAETSAELVHCHGLWSFSSLANLRWARRTARPYMVSSHGMLDPWALAHSAWKKRLAALWYERRHLRRAACLRALCTGELESIRRYGLTNPVCVISNGLDLPPAPSAAPPPWSASVSQGRQVLLYLGRLHPKKGLKALLSAWHQVQAKARTSDWMLAIAGWDQNGHEAQLRRMVNELELDNVAFLGPLFGESKQAAYARASAFVLPSVSEGLPMTVLEAWGQGCPVMMTPACNLPEGFASEAAVRVESQQNSLARGLMQLFEMSTAQRAAMGLRGRKLVGERFSWRTIASQMVSVYRWLLGGGSRPDCVQAR